MRFPVVIRDAISVRRAITFSKRCLSSGVFSMPLATGWGYVPV